MTDVLYSWHYESDDRSNCTSGRTLYTCTTDCVTSSSCQRLWIPKAMVSSWNQLTLAKKISLQINRPARRSLPQEELKKRRQTWPLLVSRALIILKLRVHLASLPGLSYFFIYCIGNGPSAIMLSLLLSGRHPHLPDEHPNPILNVKLQYLNKESNPSLLEQVQFNLHVNTYCTIMLKHNYCTVCHVICCQLPCAVQFYF